MSLFISKEFKFDAAHQLKDYQGKCENLHGHTYRLKVTLKGEVNKSGMIVDFNLMKKLIEERIIERLDHKYLNDILPQPTAENLVIWIWKELEGVLNSPDYTLYEITLWESDDSSVTCRL